jgi:hypothetical protein
MTKDSGLGDQLYINGVDIGGNINALTRIGGGPNLLPGTDITQSAMERIAAQIDAGLEFVTYHDGSAGTTHAAFSALPRTDIVLSYGHGTTLGNAAASMVGKQVAYDPQRAQDGGLLFSVQAQANGFGLTWGVQLTAGKRTDGTATNGSSVNLGSVSPGAFGLVMYWQLFAFSGTSVTIKIQSSSDDGAGDAYSDITGATSGALTAVGSGRAATAAIGIEQYLRVVTTGTFTNVIFFVQATRYDTSTGILT